MATVAGRTFRSAAVGAALACTALLAGCGSSDSPATVAGPGTSTASPTASAPPDASRPAAESPRAPQTAADTFLAPGQDIDAVPLHEPGCAAGCPLSADGTAVLSAMTWTTWSAAHAVGSGTYKLDDCDPSCAQGTVYPVAAVVTLSEPVRACSPGGTRWYWSRASFRFPRGLPKALQGPDAPENPWTFSSLATAAGQSCG